MELSDEARAVQDRHPRWEVYWSHNWLRARRRDDHAVAVRGEDPQDLDDEIVRAEAQREHSG